MIDYFALALTHALLLVALLRLVGREDVDSEALEEGDGAEAQAIAGKDKRRAGRRTRERRQRDA